MAQTSEILSIGVMRKYASYLHPLLTAIFYATHRTQSMFVDVHRIFMSRFSPEFVRKECLA